MMDEMVETIKSIINGKNSIVFDDDLGVSFKKAEDHKIKTEQRFPTGHPFFDDCCGGGFGEGELYVFVGPAKGGKSAVLTDIACKGIKNGKNVAVISLEMGEQVYLKRLSCNLMGITGDDYVKKVEEGGLAFSTYLDTTLNSLHQETFNVVGELYVKSFPTSSATVIEIENYLKKLQDTTQRKIDLVVLDYLNICAD